MEFVKYSVFKLHHRYISNVKVIGFIIAVKVKEKYVLYTLDDSTSTVDCKMWKKAVNKGKNKWNIGDWIKVEGKLNYFIDRIEINVNCMERIVDPNEELLHWLECKNIRENALKKPLKHRIDPPVIKLSKAAHKLLQILHASKIEKFQFNELLLQHEVKQLMSMSVNNTKMENECLLRLRSLVRELSRLNKIKLIDVSKDVYAVPSIRQKGNN